MSRQLYCIQMHSFHPWVSGQIRLSHLGLAVLVCSFYEHLTSPLRMLQCKFRTCSLVLLCCMCQNRLHNLLCYCFVHVKPDSFMPYMLYCCIVALHLLLRCKPRLWFFSTFIHLAATFYPANSSRLCLVT